MFQDLVREAKDGSDLAKETIIERLKPLIISSIKKYYNRRYEFDDLIQEGVLEILEGIEEYDFNANVYFLGYIKMRLRFLYLNKIEDIEIYSLNESAFNEGNEEKIDLLKDEEVDILGSILDMEENENLYKAYEKLSKREKEVIDYYYIMGMNMKEISYKLKISYRTVVNTKVNAINKLRRYIKIVDDIEL